MKSEETGYTLDEILASFNMLFLSYSVNAELTRLQVPNSFRREGLWVTYVTYDKTVVTEWYNSNDIDDNTWKSDANWRQGSNMLVGDISISSEGNWVINGVDTGSRAQGEPGITPMIRINSDNHLEVSYTNGSSYVELSDNPVFTQFRVLNNKLQQSIDLGNNKVIVQLPFPKSKNEAVIEIELNESIYPDWLPITRPVISDVVVNGETVTFKTDIPCYSTVFEKTDNNNVTKFGDRYISELKTSHQVTIGSTSGKTYHIGVISEIGITNIYDIV